MDGVLVNLEDVVLEATGYVWGQISSSYLWKQIRENASDLFVRAKPMDDAADLVDGVLKYAAEHNMVVEILTAVPMLETFPAAAEQKCEWLQRHFPELASLKFKTGPHAIDKHKHAVIGDVLIDDSKLNIRDWSHVGGIAIHHVSADESIKRLKTSGWRRMKMWG